MGKNSYKAQLNYYDSEWGWKSEGTASQGQWDGTGVRTGVLYFPGLAALKGKIINSVKLTATTGQTGYGTATTKTVYIYNSASQGGIKTSLNAGHRTGNALGSCKAPCGTIPKHLMLLSWRHLSPPGTIRTASTMAALTRIISNGRL